VQSEETVAKLASLDRDNIEITIRDIHLLRSQAKFDALERYLAQEAVFEYIGESKTFPYARRYVGKGEIIRLYKTINTEIEMLGSALLNVIVEGPDAFSRRRVDVRHRGTGVRETHEIWDLWKFRDNMVSESIKLMDFSAYYRLQGF
jgi:hypothetical protein